MTYIILINSSGLKEKSECYIINWPKYLLVAIPTKLLFYYVDYDSEWLYILQVMTTLLII